MNDTPYWQKLQDPRWQKRRLRVLEQHGWKCDACGREDKQLHVHHGHYEKGKEPWNYLPQDLHVLCAECHEERHFYEDSLKREISRMSMKDISCLSSFVSITAFDCSPRGFLNECLKAITAKVKNTIELQKQESQVGEQVEQVAMFTAQAS